LAYSLRLIYSLAGSGALNPLTRVNKFNFLLFSGAALVGSG
jgi:hypothetical protein